MDKLGFALKYAEKGISVIPVGDDKRPLIKWEPYQRERADEKQIRQWWSKFPNANIGGVTGEISDLLAVDTDTPEATQRLHELIPENQIVPIQITPKGGRHFFFKHQKGLINRARVIEGTDIRTSGGYVVLAPSENGTGKKWQWLDNLSIFDISLVEAPDALVLALKKAFSLYGDVDKNQIPSTTVYKMFNEGTRDEDLFHVANMMVKGGGKIEEVRYILEILANNCQPPFPKNEVEIKIKSAIQRAERKERNLAEEIREWLCLQTGYILSTDVHNGLQLSTREDKKNASIILKRLCEQGVIERYGDKSGCFRVLKEDLEEIDWEGADDTTLKIDMPFQINNWVELMPKNIVVIAGVHNAGKTCFMLNVALMNMDKYKILYFSSEMDGPELKKRLKKFECPVKRWKGVKFYRKEEDFARELDPNGLNIIDFLEITDKFYLVAERLREYHKKLEKGILFVAIQKDPQKDYGRGGNLGLEKPRLYINLDPGKLRIIKAKNWATDVNPNGMEWKFKLVQGSKFIVSEDKERIRADLQ